jgi:tetratricopeptide (TPR) repeat protein
MDELTHPFLSEQLFPISGTIKRVIIAGDGPLASFNCIFKYDLKAFRNIDSVAIISSCPISFRLSEAQLSDPEGSLPALQRAIITMRPNEEAWIKILAGWHQEADAWEDIWYYVRLISITSLEVVAPGRWNYVREERVGPEGVLLKRVLSEGHGPPAGANVVVAYYYSVLKQDGTEMEPITSKNHILLKVPTFETHLGLYYALLTMREGEDSVVVVPPGFIRYNYKGEIWISIQMICIAQAENVFQPQDAKFVSEEDLGNGIVKRIIKEGEGEVIKSANKLWVEIEGWLEDGFQFQKHKSEVIHFTRESRVLSISESLVYKTMKKGEACLLKCPPGTHTYEDPVSKETVWLQFYLKEYVEMLPEVNLIKDLDERFRLITQLKEIGNRLYRSGIKSESKTIYNKANSALCFKAAVLDSLDKKQQEEYFQLKSALLGNLSLVCYKEAEEQVESNKNLFEKNVKKIVEFCKQGLDINPTNAKLMFRLGKTYELKGLYEEAKEWLNKAIESDPTNLEFKSHAKTIDQKIKGENIKQKKVFQGVFNKENWEKQAAEDEKRQKILQDQYDLIEEEEQEKMADRWLKDIQTKGIKLDGIEAVNLLMEGESSDSNSNDSETENNLDSSS